MGNFLHDLCSGKVGEIRVAESLREIFGASVVHSLNKGKEYDFQMVFPDKRKETYEVKSDFMAERTGNVFFEYFCNRKPSGLTSTKADKWAVLLVHLDEIFVFCPKDMLNYLTKSKHRNLSGGDRNAVSGYVAPIDVIRKLDFVTSYSAKITP